MILFTSDTHYFHANIIKYSNRPFKHVDEMNEAMISRWNAKVGPNDTVYHLGDFGFAPTQKLQLVFDRLNGQKHLIEGNHDRDGVKIRGWCSVSKMKEVRIDDDHFVLCHYGMRVWNKSHHGSIQLFGHSHGNLPGTTQSMDVGVDTNNFAPYTVEEIKAKLSKMKPFVQEDMHKANHRDTSGY
jgi:calcineurin-like phosphoesterase family protein